MRWTPIEEKRSYTPETDVEALARMSRRLHLVHTISAEPATGDRWRVHVGTARVNLAMLAASRMEADLMVARALEYEDREPHAPQAEILRNRDFAPSTDPSPSAGSGTCAGRVRWDSASWTPSPV